MQIITKLPGVPDSAVNQALIKEVRTGFQLSKAQEDADEIVAARQAEEMKGHRTIGGLGKCVAMLPPDAYFRMIRKYGWDEVHSKDMMRYVSKRLPHLAPNKV
jgi:hypothetical protein